MSSATTHHFAPTDHVVFALTLAASLGIGLLVAARSGGATNDDYLVAGRRLGLLPAAVSMCVSVVSASTFIGAPAEMYAFGVHYQLSVLALPLGALVVAVLFVPLFYNIRLTSMNKYLFLRFKSHVIQWVGAGLVLISQVLYVGCVMYGPATALQSGLPVWASLLLTGVTGTVYTAVGGMKAVIWTDVFQSIVMVTGLLAIIIQGCVKAGGFSNVWRINQDFGRLDVNLSFDVFERYTLWTALVAYTFLTLTLFGTNQATIQRYCAMTSLTKARWSILLNVPGLAIFTTLATVAGMVAFAYYTMKGCDPLQAGVIDNSNQLMPHFVTEVLNVPGLPGLFVASLFCATLSTLSSSENSMVAVIWEDILESRFGHLKESYKSLINRTIALVIGVVFLVWGAGGNILQISFTLAAITSGSQVGLFVIGMLVPWANWKGALGGTLSSMLVTAWLGFGQIYHRQQRHHLPTDVSRCDPMGGNYTGNYTTLSSFVSMETSTEALTIDESSEGRSVFELSFLVFPLIGFAVSLIIGILLSLITGGQDLNEVDPTLVFPCMRRFCRGQPWDNIKMAPIQAKEKDEDCDIKQDVYLKEEESLSCIKM